MNQRSDKNILTQVINLGQEITSINDVDVLLEKILREARRFGNADAGSIYVRQDDNLVFRKSQNDTLQSSSAEGKKLIYTTFSVPVDNHSIAGYAAKTGRPVNIPDVYMLGPSVPYSFDKSYDQLSHYRTKSMLTFPLKNPQNQILGVLQLINARDENGRVTEFDPEDEPYIMYFAHSAAIALERAQRTREIILRMLRMAEMRDPKETGSHVNRVGSYSAALYESWAASRGEHQSAIEKKKDVLRMAAMLHDVGKVAISDMILKKPSRLDVNEFEIMKQHTFLGARLFVDSHSEFDSAAFHIALEHHERWDGQGYPGAVYLDDLSGAAVEDMPREKGAKKRGDQIHPFGRIVALADVYDALCSRRCYKAAWEEGRVLDTIRSESGKQFDPEMVDAFFDVADIFHAIRKEYPDSEADS